MGEPSCVSAPGLRPDADSTPEVHLNDCYSTYPVFLFPSPQSSKRVL